MAKFRMALTAGGPKRLELRTALFAITPCDVRFDEHALGRIDTVAELREGRSFTLDDGTTLRVVLETSGGFARGNRLRVERDGSLLRDCPAHPAYEVRQAAVTLRALGVLTVLYGLLTVFVDAGTGAAAGVGIVLEGAVYLGLGYAAQREKRWALNTGLALYALDTIFALGSLGLGGWILHALIAMLLVRGVLAHHELGRVDAASIADVFR